KIDGLDRVKLLTQLVSFDSLDRAIPSTSRKEALSSLKSSSFNARAQELKILIAYDILHSFKKHRLESADKRALQLLLQNSIKKVALILTRPVCQGTVARAHKVPINLKMVTFLHYFCV
ncbi:hypothetical protein PMAYCL1PPCAC_20712, partial [Pristionchus mayeri]